MKMAMVNSDYCKEVKKARRLLRALVFTKQCAPIILCLAWHDAITYDAKTNTEGPSGSIRYEAELWPDANNGLKIAVDFCEGVKAKCPRFSYADRYQGIRIQLAGIVAVEVTGGPTIDFVPGRKDSMESPEEGQLPYASKGARHLREVFFRMGLSDKDIVALSGGHTLEKAHKERSGFDGVWTKVPLQFDNSYFMQGIPNMDLLKGDSQGLLKLPTDRALVEDPEFRRFVELYAKDEEAFFRDYAESHKKISELGFILPPSKKLVKKRITAPAAVVVSVATALLILSYLTEVGKSLN